jgi:hypothetical protein
MDKPKILKVKWFHQEKTLWCWAACIQMIKHYYNHSLLTQLSIVGSDDNVTGNLENIKWLNRLDNLTFYDIKNLIDHYTPLIARQGEHNVLIVGYYEDNNCAQYLFYHDPAPSKFGGNLIYYFNVEPECVIGERFENYYYTVRNKGEGLALNTNHLNVQNILTNNIQLNQNNNAIYYVFVKLVEESVFFSDNKNKLGCTNSSYREIIVINKQQVNFGNNNNLLYQKFCGKIGGWITIKSYLLIEPLIIKVIYKDKNIELCKQKNDVREIKPLSNKQKKWRGNYEKVKFLFLQYEFYRFKGQDTNYYLVPVRNYNNLTKFKKNYAYQESKLLKYIKNNYYSHFKF